jgi:biopolymer transport protein ExbD
MKRLGKKREGDISPDLTSFSDIANLLIIFFILTTSLARPFGRQMDMPSSAKPPEEQKNEADTPTINLSADRITISENGKEGRELTMDQLRAELWKKNFPSRSEKDRAVVLETSDDVKYERYYQVATAIAAAGGVVAIMEN